MKSMPTESLSNLVLFCKKFAQGKVPVPAGRLSQDAVTKLASFYAQTIDPNDVREVQQLLAQHWERGFWFVCPCNVKTPACWLPCRVGARYYLRRLEGRGMHLDGCPFKPRAYQPSPHPVGTEHEAKPLDLHRGLSETPAIEDHVPMHYSSQRKFRLSGFLYDLLAKAEINRVSWYIPDPQEFGQALANAIGGIYLAKGVPAKDLFFVGVETDPFDPAIVALENDAHAWPIGARRYALTAGIFDKIENNTLICHRTGNRVLCKGQVKYLRCTGPYLVLATVAEDLTLPGMFSPMHAFGLPIVMRPTWFPVQSHFERMAFILIHYTLRNIFNAAYRIVLEKPLRPMRIAEDLPEIWPDFLLHAKWGTLVIEVMGSKGTDYLARKDRLIPVMARLGPVLKIDASSIDSWGRWTGLVKKLAAFLCNWTDGRFKAGEIYELESFPSGKWTQANGHYSPLLSG